MIKSYSLSYEFRNDLDSLITLTSYIIWFLTGQRSLFIQLAGAHEPSGLRQGYQS